MEGNKVNKLHVKKNDTVVVVSGKDKGAKGKVLTALPKKERVIVEGVNIITRHQKARGQQRQGGILHMEGAIHASNVMLVCPSCGKATRNAHKVLADGTVVRQCKKCGETIDE